jgi:hypothetical protein
MQDNDKVPLLLAMSLQLQLVKTARPWGDGSTLALPANGPRIISPFINPYMSRPPPPKPGGVIGLGAPGFPSARGQLGLATFPLNPP